LRVYLYQLDPELTVADGGGEKRISSSGGQPDIIAIDATKTIVAIELKHREAVPKHVKQIQDYMDAIKTDTKFVETIQRCMKDPQINGQGVRGILIARSFTQEAIAAAKDVPNLELQEYSFEFKFLPK
jgi:RecB family endonuclease NucS